MAAVRNVDDHGRSPGFAQLVAALWVALGSPAAAHSPTPPVAASAPVPAGASSDVVVRARKARLDRTLSQVRALTSPTAGQVTRFEIEVCPAVLGLPRPMAAVVEAQVRVLAAAAGVGSATSGCAPNLVVVVAEDGRGFVRTLRRRHPNLFESLALHDADRLADSPGPAWAWRLSRAARRDGGPLEFIGAIRFGGSSPPLALSPGAYRTPDASFSRLSVPVRQDTLAAYVVLSAPATAGLTLRQLGDYAGMTGLIAVRQRGVAVLARPSILTMFDDTAAGRAPQAEATRFDLALLAATYSGETGFTFEQKSLQIATEVERALGATPAP